MEPYTKRLHLTQYADSDELAAARFEQAEAELVEKGWIVTTSERVEPEIPDHMPAGQLPAS